MPAPNSPVKTKPKPKPPPTFFELPGDILVCIASFLTSSELVPILSLFHNWYSCVSDASVLWRWVDMDFSDKNRASLTRIVKYSKDQSLVLHLHNVSVSNCRSIVAALEATMSRLCDLGIWVNDTQNERSVAKTFSSLLPTLRNRQAPSLTRLALAGYEYEVKIPVDIFAHSAPRLTTLVLESGITTYEHTPAFSNVRTLTTCPESWDVVQPLRHFPRLGVMHFCGEFNPSEEDIPFIGAGSVLPDFWRPFDTLGFRIAMVDDPEQLQSVAVDALSIARGAMAAGVENVTLRSSNMVSELFKGIFPFLPPTQSLSITCGGYDFGLEFSHGQATGLAVSFTDTQGRTLTVAHTSSSGTAPTSNTSSSLWRDQWPQRFTSLRQISLCESLLVFAWQPLTRLRLPEVSILTVYILPWRLRSASGLLPTSSCLFWDPPTAGDRLIVPKLRTLRLGVAPAWPGYSYGGNMVTSSWSPAMMGDAYEISASCVRALVEKRLNFGRFPLQEIVLDAQVCFYEGFSPAKTIFGTLVGKLVYPGR